MLIGYARISTTDQTLALQQDALTAAGCNKLFTDTASGTRTDRPGLTEALSYVRSGDTLVVWRLDRLGRSLGHLIETVRDLQDRGVHFRSLQEQLDTGTSGGKLVFHVFGALAEFERDLIRERTMAGLAAARSRGRRGGRPTASATTDVPASSSTSQPSTSGLLSSRPWSASKACSTSLSPSGLSGASVLTRRNTERHEQRLILVAEARGQHPTQQSKGGPGGGGSGGEQCPRGAGVGDEAVQDAAAEGGAEGWGANGAAADEGDDVGHGAKLVGGDGDRAAGELSI
jgi:hypothetical protein